MTHVKLNPIERQFSVGQEVTFIDGYPDAGVKFRIVDKVLVPDNMVASVGNYHWYDLGQSRSRVSGAILQLV